MLSVRVENKFPWLCHISPQKMVRWAAVAKDSKLAVNHIKYHFTHACLQNWESISPTISEKIGCYFFILFLLFLLSPLFFPSQLIRKTLSVTKTQSGRHNIYGWREGWYRPSPPAPWKRTLCRSLLSVLFICLSVLFPGLYPTPQHR